MYGPLEVVPSTIRATFRGGGGVGVGRGIRPPLAGYLPPPPMRFIVWFWHIEFVSPGTPEQPFWPPLKKILNAALTIVTGYCIIKYLYMLTIVLILDIYHSYIYTGFFSGGGGGGGGSSKACPNHITRKFGGGLNLAVWQYTFQLLN